MTREAKVWSIADFELTHTNTRQHLLALRGTTGHWVGNLSSSALSTATALFSLGLFVRHHPCLSKTERMKFEALIDGGIQWLVAGQNPDGGWGDTTCSPSNISTTALCWSALSVATIPPEATQKLAESWLIRVAGSLEPPQLAQTIAALYGKDRTFSVPILTMCALSGRFGAGREAWKVIPALPFELAACPYKWFQWLRLPVVSYALPALIAIGQVIHHFHPTHNPILRGIREQAKARTLSVLKLIQPEGGGFLEAVPLTSFVSMSLIGCGQWNHPVVATGIEFLVRSVREDGSWPIDTNLATWLTTLTINVLAEGPDFETLLSAEEKNTLCDWLVGQQYRVEHPYTHAPPGGWAWTNLPGGVPDADDTAGALIALSHVGERDSTVMEAARTGVTWLLNLQNRDGGIPTFCRGWGALPFDRSGADLTAHALIAWNIWRDHLPAPLPRQIRTATMSSLNYLRKQQRENGSWIPLWFGNHAAPEEQNPTYGTARVLMALLTLNEHEYPHLSEMKARGIEWLLQAQNAEGGWGGDRTAPASLEETGLALSALSLTLGQPAQSESATWTAVERGISWLIQQTNKGQLFPPAPIGFYFARLWYFEELYPVISSLGAMEMLAKSSCCPPLPEQTAVPKQSQR